jgi:hypothetical protein
MQGWGASSVKKSSNCGPANLNKFNYILESSQTCPYELKNAGRRKTGYDCHFKNAKIKPRHEKIDIDNIPSGVVCTLAQ